MKKMVIAVLFLSFLLNIFNHGNLLIAILNTILLLFSIYFYLKFSHQNLNSTLVVLIGAMPILTRANDILVVFIAIGMCLLMLCYLTTKYRKISLLMIILYILFFSCYANGLIKLPFLFQSNLLILNDNWTNLYITQMKTESQYMPGIIRSAIFNSSVNFYVMLSKIAALFSLKNLSEILLIANIYPLISGLTLGLKNWNKSKALLIFLVFLISFGMVFSRSEDKININTFVLLSPFLIYLILKGLNSINKTVYLALFVVSIVIAASP